MVNLGVAITRSAQAVPTRIQPRSGTMQQWSVTLMGRCSAQGHAE
jgi:hypothetical protein